MADSKFDLSKLKENVGDLVGNIKSMINPAGATPTVDPDDALGIKIAKLTTLIQTVIATEKEQMKNLTECNTLLNGVFQDVEALRNKCKTQKVMGSTEAAPEKSTDTEKKSD